MLQQKERSFNIEKLLTNRRGKITSSNILKLLVVFSILIFFQCSTLLLTKDYILYNNVSTTQFLFISFTLTCIISIIQQKSWKYLSYLNINPKRIPIILFQAMLYSLSFLCLMYGLITNGILQYYCLINLIQILNVFSNINKIFANTQLLARLQLFIGLLCFIIAIYLLASSNYCYSSITGLIALTSYHFLSYVRRQHYNYSSAKTKSFKRTEPFVLLLSAFIILSASFLTHLPHHNHSLDIQQQFLSDERAFMHHSAIHEHEHEHDHKLLSTGSHKQKMMKELEELVVINNNNNNKDVNIIEYTLWSIIIYILFVLFFILLNTQLSYLQTRIYELIFVDKKLNNVIKYTKSKQSDSNKPIADILKLVTLSKGDRNDIIDNQIAVPLWAKLIFLYQFVSIQCIAMISYLLLTIFGLMLNWNNSRNSPFVPMIASFTMLVGNEFSTRSLRSLQLPYHPNWLNRILHFLFGYKIKHHHHHHGHGHHINIPHHHNNITAFIQHLRETTSSRRIFIFLSLNFLFMFVEFIYGYLSNSLGLISDACHMLFDCIALVIGLLASYLGSPHYAQATATADGYGSGSGADIKYSYGYGKMKVLSGFINAIFLVYIGVSVLIESFERIINPPHIHTADQLLIVSVLGLLVNLVGLFFFHDAHMHSHGHGHSHSDCNHGHGHNHNDHNIRGIFLHILADTLGSVGVIISSLLIYFFDLIVFDALCSVFIAILIFLTVYPLIKSTSKILLQETPSFILPSFARRLESGLSSVSGIIGYREAHFWEYEPGKLIGTIHIQITEDANEQQLLSQINDILKQRFGFKSEKDLTIQIEKQSYLDKCDPIHHSVYSKIIPIKNLPNTKKTINKIHIDDHDELHSNCNHNHNHS